MEELEQKGFSAENFVDRLLNEAVDISYDENSKQFNEQVELPPYYNEELYKKGQKFFHKHITAVLFGNLIALLSLGGSPAVKLIKLTNKSNTPMTAYRRYLAAALHIFTWYDDDFRPGSRLLSSIAKVRNMHKFANKLGSKKINYGINQRDMALAQFAFMGFVIVRDKMVGVHNATEEELKGFIHLWRVIGYLLGMDEKYNICRESVQETKDIGNFLIDKYLRPTLDDPPEEYYQLAKVGSEGFRAMNPFIQFDVGLCYTYMVLENATYDNLSNKSVQNLSGGGRLKLRFIETVLAALENPVVRIAVNCLQIISIWMLRNCPVLAYYKFGVKNSNVTI